MGKAINSRKFRGGAYATALSFLVIVVLVVVNLVSGRMFTYKDLTSTGKYSLSEASREFLKGFNAPVELYYVTSEGEEELTIQQSAEQIAAANDNIHLHYKDPVQYPQFVYQYNKMAEITNNSIIVINGNDDSKYCYIDSDQMRIYDIDMQTLTRYQIGYDAELEIIKAIVSVTQESKGTVYMTSGHGEWEWIQGGDEESLGKVTETFLDLMGLNAYTVRYCNLTKEGAVPKDCNILFIGSPISDLTEGEVTAIENYLTGGGTVILSLMFNTNTFVNLQSLMRSCGLEFYSGVVCESDVSRTVGDNVTHVLGEYGKRNTVWPGVVPIKKTEVQKKTTTITALCETSSKAYVRELTDNLALTDSDTLETYPLLVKSEDTFNGVTGTMYVFSSTYFLSDVYLTGSASYANRFQLLECMAGVQTEDAASALSIPNTTAMEEALQMTTNQRNNVAMLSFLFPAVILVAGIVVVLRRRVEKVTTQ